MPSGWTLLLHARKLIEQGWTQDTDARDADGRPIQPWSPLAVAWSLLGALVAALQAETGENEPLAVGQLAVTCVALAAVIEHDSLESWNDDASRTLEDVLEALGRAETRTARTPSEPNPWN
jgi:hypothetical protein